MDVLRLICEDTSIGEVADQLCLSVVTVRNHIQHILRKLGVHSKLQAILLARRTCLV